MKHFSLNAFFVGRQTIKIVQNSNQTDRRRKEEERNEIKRLFWGVAGEILAAFVVVVCCFLMIETHTQTNTDKAKSQNII